MTDFTEIIEVAQEAAGPQIVESGGRFWSQKPLSLVSRPVNQKIVCRTLTGFADAYRVVCEEKSYVWITAPWRASLCAGHNDGGEIRCLAEAEMEYPYRLNRDWSKLEDLLIALQTHFHENAQRSDLVKLLSSIRTERVVDQIDDSASQSVVAATRVVPGAAEGKTWKQVPNPWTLKPVVSFPEINPPEIPFLLRFESSQGGVHARLIPIATIAWQLPVIAEMKQKIFELIGVPELKIIG